MFKSIRVSNRDSRYYILRDTDFTTELTIPWERLSGSRKYRIKYNRSYARECPKHISRALAIVLEYKKRNLNITKTLALYYLSNFSTKDLRTNGNKSLQTLEQMIAESKLWFATYCPDLEFDKHTKCLKNKIQQYKWIKQLYINR